MKPSLAGAALTFLTLTSLSSLPARADNITFSLDNPSQSAASGGSVTFLATVTAPASNTSIFYLNSDAVNANPFDAGDASYVDDGGFINNFLPVSFSPGYVDVNQLFTVTLPLDVPSGFVYSGTFTLQGGIDFSDYDDLATESFSVTAMNATTPEPSGLLLVGTGLAGTLAVLRRRKFLRLPPVGRDC